MKRSRPSFARHGRAGGGVMELHGPELGGRRGRQCARWGRQRGACVPRRSGRARDAEGMRDDAAPTLTVTDVWSTIPGVSRRSATTRRGSRSSTGSPAKRLFPRIPLATGTDCASVAHGGHGLARDLEPVRPRSRRWTRSRRARAAGPGYGCRGFGGHGRDGREADLLLVHGNPPTTSAASRTRPGDAGREGRSTA